jgi:DNA repair protein RadC
VRVTTYRTRLTENKRVELEKEVSVNLPELNAIRSPLCVAELATGYLEMDQLPEEYLYMVCLNTKNKITGVFELSHGNVNSSIFGVREMFQKALLVNAVSIILLHNHPSGDCTPSSEDISATERAMEAGKIIGVPVLDHLIIGNGCFTSLKEKGYMQ